MGEAPIEIFYIDVVGEVIENNHVVNDWLFEYTVDGKDVSYFYKGYQGDKIELKITATEKDGNPDVASTYVDIELNNDFAKNVTLTVKENGGPYKGKTAKIQFTVTVRK